MFVHMSLQTIVYMRLAAILLAQCVAFVSSLCVPRGHTTPLRWVQLLLGIELVNESVCAWAGIKGINNSILVNLYQPLEMVLLLVFFSEWRPQWRTWLAGVGAMGLAAWAVLWVLNDPWSFLITEAVLITALLQTAVILVALWHLAEHSERPLWHEPYFWFLLGNFAYFGGVFPIIGPLRQLETNSPMMAFNLFIIISILAVLRSLLTATACLLMRHQALHPRTP